MRRRRTPVPWASLASVLAISSLPFTSANQRPFVPVQTATPELLRRQSTDGCLANFYSCSGSGSQFANICCQIGQTCALDQGGNPACCPANAICTGIAPSEFTLPTNAPAVSYLPNPYFSFPYIPTVFAGPAACTSALSQCSANSAACASNLASGDQGYGVTVIVPGGGGITVSHTDANLGTAAASSVCASLSSSACFGIQGGVCTPGRNGVFVVGSSNPAVPTAAPRAREVVIGAVVAGVGVGVWRW